MVTGTYGSPAVEVDRAAFDRAMAVAFEHRVQALRVRGGEAVLVLVDTSDC